jgi:hypothetical protein
MGHESGSKSARANNLIASQKEAIDKFVIKETRVSSDKQSVDPSTLALNITAYNNPTDGKIET